MQSYTGQYDLNAGDLVKYNSGGLTVGNCYIQQPYYWPVYENVYHHWYPTYIGMPEKSKVEQGFKIVAKMLENKIITKALTIKEFIKLVNDIAEIL